MNDELQYLFQKLEFTDLAIKLLEKILDYGLINHNNIPEEKTKEAFNWLKINGIIFIKTHENGEQVVLPVHPKIFLNSFYLRKVWKILPFPEKHQNLSENEVQDLVEYKDICANIESLLLNYYGTKFNWDEEHGISYILPESLPTILATDIFSAEKEILGIVTKLWTPNISLIWSSLTEKIRSGVLYRRISDEYTWIAFGYKINKRDIEQMGINFRVLPSISIQEKFFSIDNKVILLYTPNISQNNFTLEAMRVTLPYVIDLQRDRFDKMWEKAMDTKIILNHMKKLRDKFLNESLEIAPEALNFLEGLFDYGIFFNEILPDKATVEKLKQSSIIVDDPQSSTGFIPNIFNDIRSIIHSR